MAIGTPLDLGVATLTTGVNTVMTITTTATAPSGSLVYVPVLSTNSTAISSVADSNGNSYTLISPQNIGGNIIGGGYIVLPGALNLGATITITFAATLGRKLASAISVTGISASPLDLNGAGATATDTTPTITTGTLSQADEVIFMFTYVNSGSGDTWTESSGFTSLANTSVDTRIIRPAYQIVSSTSAVSYAATNSVSRAWTINYHTFKAASAVVASGGATAGLMGI